MTCHFLFTYSFGPSRFPLVKREKIYTRNPLQVVGSQFWILVIGTRLQRPVAHTIYYVLPGQPMIFRKLLLQNSHHQSGCQKAHVCIAFTIVSYKMKWLFETNDG